MKGIDKNDRIKIYTLNVPPTPDKPFLTLERHREIISYFKEKGDAYYTLNSYGEVDFYLLEEDGNTSDDLADVAEQFRLRLQKNKGLDVEIKYNDELFYLFSFNLNKVMDKHILEWLVKEERVNIYYLACFEQEYFCTGLKTIALPQGLIYDLARFLQGKRFLMMPTFLDKKSSDRELTKARLLQESWGFYLDYSSLLQRIGSVAATEEILSRHIFDCIAKLQGSRSKQIEEDELILWIGRKVEAIDNEQPKEYYSFFLSGERVNPNKRNPAKVIVEKALRELPELKQIKWVSPLAEEGIPFAVISLHQVSRFKLTPGFFSASDQLYREKYLPYRNYINNYHKIVHDHLLLTPKTNIYSFIKKHKEKGGH